MTLKKPRSSVPYMLGETNSEEASYKYYIRTYKLTNTLYIQTRNKTECDLKRTFLSTIMSNIYMLNGSIYTENNSSTDYFTKEIDSNLVSMTPRKGGLLDTGQIQLFKSNYVLAATSNERDFEQLSYIFNGYSDKYVSYKWNVIEWGYAIKNGQYYRVQGFKDALTISQIGTSNKYTKVHGFSSDYTTHGGQSYTGHYQYYALCIHDNKLYMTKNTTNTLIETEYPIEKFPEQINTGYSYYSLDDANKKGPYLIDTQGNMFYLNGYNLSLTQLPSKYQKICTSNLSSTNSYLSGTYGLSNGRIKVVNNTTETDLGIEGVQDVCGCLRDSSSSYGQGFYAKDNSIYCISRTKDKANTVKSTKVLDLPEEEELVSLQGGTGTWTSPIFVITRVKQ